MGREVASAYRRRKYPAAFPRSRSSSSTTNSSMDSLSDAPPNLTPARKHHKLLKDGSEVWSKDVEKIFVQGLRQYWQSPWATYSRGRSRWRNQFLVDHLKKAGIERTKKQVASHIQVLRNMWRGQPEFHLVAGGEELFQENGLLAHPDRSAHSASSQFASTNHHDLPGSSGSSPSSTPEYPTSEFPPEFAASTTFPSHSPHPQMLTFPEMGSEDVLGTSAPISSSFGFGPAPFTSSPTQMMTPLPVKLEQLPMADPTLFDFAMPPPNRVSNLYFWADGMVPLSVDVDQLVGADPSMRSRVVLNFKVSLPPVADLRCPPNLQGINGAVSFANSWSSLAKCQTKGFGSNKSVVSQELGVFSQVNTPEFQGVFNANPSLSQMAYAYLPESALSRCHWLDTNTITQQLVVDNEVLAVLVYDIERAGDLTRTVPAMELVGFRQAPTSAPASTPFHPMLMSSSPSISPRSSPLVRSLSYSSTLSSQSPSFTQLSLPGGNGIDDPSSRILSYPFSTPPQPAFAFHPH